MIKNLPADAGDTGLIPGLGRFPEVANGSPLQYSCLGNPMGLVGDSPRGRKESGTTERLSMHTQEGRGAACVAFQTGPSAKLTASLSLGLFTCKAQVMKPSREDAVGEWNGARYEGSRVELMQDQGSGFSCELLSVLGALSGSAGVLRDGSGAQGDMSSKGDTSTAGLQWTWFLLPMGYSRNWRPATREIGKFSSFSKCGAPVLFARPKADCLEA